VDLLEGFGRVQPQQTQAGHVDSHAAFDDGHGRFHFSV
jgi:hypothetical protein